MPPAEGWYSYYAYLINEQGAVPYVDFELLFPPLYTYLIAVFTRVFGYSIIALRILGVVLFAATGAVAVLIFDQLTDNRRFAMLAGPLAALVLQSEVVQVFYDYIRVMDLHVYLSVYFFLRYFARLDRGEERRYRLVDKHVLLGAVFAVLASMYKQSSGLFFLLFCYAVFLFLFILPSRKREYLRHLLTLLGTTVVLYGTMLLLLASKGALDEYFYYNFSASVSAKGGSLFDLLFGWILRDGKHLLTGSIVAVLFFAAVFVLSHYAKRFEDTENKPRSHRYWAILIGSTVLVAGGVITLGIRVLLRNNWYFFRTWKLMAVLVILALVFGSLAFGMILRRRLTPVPDGSRYRYFFLSGSAFVLAFAVCTSGGVTESQSALGYPLIAAILLPHLTFRRREIAACALSVVMLFEAGIAWGRKSICMYTWWGLDVGAIWEQTEGTDVPLLKGLRMKKEYAQMYEAVYRDVTAFTTPEDPIFVFPHMPILYLMTERDKATDTAIQWFDVSTDAAVIADIDRLKEHPPKMMVLSTVGDYAVASHESSFRGGEQSGLGAMRDFLPEFRAEQGYRLLGSYQVSADYTVTVWILP